MSAKEGLALHPFMWRQLLGLELAQELVTQAYADIADDKILKEVQSGQSIAGKDSLRASWDKVVREYDEGAPSF